MFWIHKGWRSLWKSCSKFPQSHRKPLILLETCPSLYTTFLSVCVTPDPETEESYEKAYRSQCDETKSKYVYSVNHTNKKAVGPPKSLAISSLESTTFFLSEASSLRRSEEACGFSTRSTRDFALTWIDCLELCRGVSEGDVSPAVGFFAPFPPPSPPSNSGLIPSLSLVCETAEWTHGLPVSPSLPLVSLTFACSVWTSLGYNKTWHSKLKKHGNSQIDTVLNCACDDLNVCVLQYCSIVTLVSACFPLQSVLLLTLLASPPKCDSLQWAAILRI